MIKPKKKRKGDANQVAYSVVQDVIALSNRPVVPPPIKKPKKKR
jgi:lipopolysaccharide export system protein LptA